MRANPRGILLAFLLFGSSVTIAQTIFPDISIKPLNGSLVPLKSVIDSNDITIICFWATWCVPCVNELDALQEKLNEEKQPHFRIMAISIDEARTAQKVKPMIKARGWSFAIYLDESNQVKQAFNVSNIPFVILAGKGRIVYQKSGYVPGDEEILFEKINQLLTEDEL
jgi:peroxiredoxin